jgi:hypothetical protein
VLQHGIPQRYHSHIDTAAGTNSHGSQEAGSDGEGQYLLGLSYGQYLQASTYQASLMDA